LGKDTGFAMNRTVFAFLAILVVATVALAAARKSQAPQEPLPTPAHADAKYGSHERNVLDLWLARSDQPTPLVVFIHGGGFVAGELIMSFPMEIIAFDPLTGHIRWRRGGLNPLVYTSPIAGEGVIVAMGGYRGNTVAVKATQRLWHSVRAKGGSCASLLLSGDRLYFALPSGDIAVLKLSPKFEVLSVNSLKEKSNSSLAASNGDRFFRTEQTLGCIGKR